MEKKTVIVLPGSFWQIPIIKKSKSLGYRTLVINPYKDSPAFSFADGYLQSDIFDMERVLNYCKEQKADAVISEECDIAMPLVAEIGRRLSLSTLDSESAHLYTDKSAMREFCKKNRLFSPEYKLCRSLEEAEEFFDRQKSGIIIKPLDSNSSRGVFKIRKKEDLKKNFKTSILFSKIQKAVLAEQYIDGTEFTVDGIKTPERHFTLAISEKKHFMHNPNIACELYFTGKNNRYDYDALELQNNLFVELSPLQFGLTHAEYKYKDGKFYLIEIAARGGGNLISSHIAPFMSGVDNYRYLLDCSLDNVTAPDFTIPESYKNRCAVLRFFQVPYGGGIVERIDGIDILENTPQIVEYKFNFKIGDRICDASTDADRAGFYIACCEQKDELDEVMRMIQDKVKIFCK